MSAYIDLNIDNEWYICECTCKLASGIAFVLDHAFFFTFRRLRGFIEYTQISLNSPRVCFQLICRGVIRAHLAYNYTLWTGVWCARAEIVGHQHPRRAPPHLTPQPLLTLSRLPLCVSNIVRDSISCPLTRHEHSVHSVYWHAIR